MVKNLTEKIILEAQKKADSTIKKAEHHLEKMLFEKKEIITKEFEQKLAYAKNRIDQQVEREISNFRMEKEKEILDWRNRMIKEVMTKVEEKFNRFLADNMKDIIAGFTKEIEEKGCIVKVPETAQNIKIEGVHIEVDPQLKNAFRIEGKNWHLLFNWERFSLSISGHIKQKVASYLFGNERKNNQYRNA